MELSEVQGPSMRHVTLLVVTVLAFLFAGRVGVVEAQTTYSHLVVIVGAAGDDVYQEVFHNGAIELIDAATNKLNLSPAQITYLGEHPDLASHGIAARSNRENIEQTIARLAIETGPDDQIFFVLIGHGTGAGEQSRFNIPGRDITALEYDGMLNLFATQEIGFVNTASASGDFVNVLSGLNRVIVTATRDGRQNNQTIFPRFFVQAFAQDVADLGQGDRQCDADGEPDNDRVRHAADKFSHLAGTQDDQHDACADRAEDEHHVTLLIFFSQDLGAIASVGHHDTENDGDVGGGRTVDLEFRSAEQRAEEPGKGAANNSVNGVQSRGNRKAHGQRNGHHGHDQPGSEVTEQGTLRVGSHVFIATVVEGR